MAKIIGVRFKNAGKLFYFSPADLWPKPGEFVIVDTIRGQSYGQVITGVREIEDSLLETPLKDVIRIATDEDAAHMSENEAFEKKAFDICFRKIEEHQLEMKLVRVEQTFDNTKLVFYFTANGRVDFRSLVKDLASVFHTRIELRQIGVRDEARMIGGLGPCGLPICCGTFLGDFQPVSIKMAKEQNLSLNPTKISGVCGRLMCCLKFEDEHYVKTRKRMPKLGKDVETPEGFGTVVDLNILKETVNVRIQQNDSHEIKTFSIDDIVWFKMNRDDKKQDNNQKPKRKSKAKSKPAKDISEEATQEDDVTDIDVIVEDDDIIDSDVSEELDYDDEPFEQEPLSDEIVNHETGANNWQLQIEEALRNSGIDKS